MKKSNKLTNSSKKAIRYVAFATGLMAASLPNKANADLLNVNADVNVLGLAGVGVGANVGNGVSAGVRANVLGVGAGVGVSALTSPTYVAPTYVAPSYGYAAPARRVVYAAAPATTYVAPATRYVATPDVVYRSVRPAVTYRPAPVVYRTAAQAPVESSAERVEVQTYDSYSHEGENSEYTHTVQKRLVEDQANRYREQEVHSRKVIKTRRVYYTYE